MIHPLRREALEGGMFQNITYCCVLEFVFAKFLKKEFSIAQLKMLNSLNVTTSGVRT